MASVTQPVPSQEALLVELPCYVEDPARAIARLGGSEAVGALTAGQASFLNFHFRPTDRLAHPLVAERRPARGLLLRISRKAATGAGAAAMYVLVMVHACSAADHQCKSTCASMRAACACVLYQYHSVCSASISSGSIACHGCSCATHVA